MIRIGMAAAVGLTLAGLLAPAGAADPPPSAPPRVTVPRVADVELSLDGRLDEAVWQQAAEIGELTQHEPHPGEPTPYRTRVLVFSDGEALYLGYECVDPEPEKIVTQTLQRDGGAFSDDSIDFVLDTFGDQSTAYYFLVTAGGARLDGLIGTGGFPSLDWDGSWDAKARRTPTGWSAELVIPARILHFRRGTEGWGFNLARQVAREQLILRWSGWTRDASFFDLRSAGRLDGLGDLEQGIGLAVAPFAVVRSSEERPEPSSTHGRVGLDLSYNFTPELAGVLTYRTDFAEAEVDTRQINLTRFPLFFPEKRTFFVEGANQFEFAYGLGTSFVPFFSRRIGLFQGREVPLDVGLKALGHVGPLSVGALGVRTRDSADGPPATTLAAGRFALDFGPHWRVGTLFTDGDPSGERDNRLAGFDVLYRTSTFRGNKNLFASAWGAQSSGDLAPGQREGWGARIEYPNDLWQLHFDVREFGDALDPALGFLPRPGTRAFSAGTAYQPRPRPEGRYGWGRQFFFEAFADVVTDLDGDVESWQLFLAPFNVNTRSGDHYELNVVPTFERLDAPFEIAPGVVIEPGDYRFDRFRVQAEAAPSRRLRPAITVWFGEHFDGHLTQWIPRLSWSSPHGHFRLEANAEFDVARLPAGDFEQRLYGLRVVWAATPDVVLSSFSQLDSESDLVGSNTLFRWTIAPGRDLFVVYNKSWDREDGRGLRPRGDQASVKLRWTFWR